ncbi:hypothetical protein LTR97_010763 [Elasticomyces elasticus]|uniref:BTB domain-containing protein n=1 Tax=Elasticomyces elasticus TaxID=574655 RepID=A0AAN7VXP9_9PEZI|nr:hypothetical protein LTR97_010763 [Elasticomyces elasticus]KAK5718667.1 hypothetical protein LTR15_008400 [Elasticomyces elasticus]
MHRVDILPDGDIILAIKGSLELRVSSLVLSMVSPVFKTMLGPHFAEGQALRHQSAGVLHILTLPDDDAQLMKVLCLISYHQADAVTVSSVPAKFIIELATLADKYDCLSILKYPVTSWAAAIDPESLDAATRCACAEAAFKLDDAQLFGRCTKALVLDGDSWSPAGRATSCRVSIADAVRKTETCAEYNVVRLIDNVVTDAAGRLGSYYEHDGEHNPTLDWYGCPRYSSCEFNKVAIGTLMHALSVARLWPPSSRGHTLRDILHSTRTMKVPRVTAISPCKTCLDKSTENILEMFERNIGGLRADFNDIFTAVCLDCLKQIGDENSICRTPHHGEWATSDEDGNQRLHYDRAKLNE